MKRSPIQGLLLFVLASCAHMAPEAVCPAGPTVEGIDVSVYQGAIDWQRVAAAGIDFAYIRVGDGLRPVDARFAENWAGARAAGVARGGYQFFRQDADAIAQADLFVNTIGVLDGDDLPPAIDVETADGQDAGTIIANVSAWMARVEDGTGRRPIIYTGRAFWEDHAGGSTAVADHDLWIAHWGVACPSIPTAWKTWRFWQYTATGMVDGISVAVDRDRFNGSLRDLADASRQAATAFAGRRARARISSP